MLQSLKKIFTADAEKQQAHEAYVAIVAQARKPFFYRKYGVPDTLDGRFDVIVLHLFLVIHRLRGVPEAAEFIRGLSEVFFADMDRSLREMGVGDTGVGRRVKNMAQAFYGRLAAYEQAANHPGDLAEALQRNLYRGAEADTSRMQFMISYLQRNTQHLSQQAAQEISGGLCRFLD